MDLISSSPEPQQLNHVVIIFHQNSHWCLIHFNVRSETVYLIDSLPYLGVQRVTTAHLEVCTKLVNILLTEHQAPLVCFQPFQDHNLSNYLAVSQ